MYETVLPSSFLTVATTIKECCMSCFFIELSFLIIPSIEYFISGISIMSTPPAIQRLKLYDLRLYP